MHRYHCCSVLQCVVVYCNELLCVAACSTLSVLQYAKVSCSVLCLLQCVAVRYSDLQRGQ